MWLGKVADSGTIKNRTKGLKKKKPFYEISGELSLVAKLSCICVAILSDTKLQQ